MADSNVVAHVPAGEISLPMASWESLEDVLLFMEKNPDVAKKVQKIVEPSETNAIKIVGVGETMNNLMTISSTIKHAVAASHGYPCNPIVIKMLSRFQTLVKDCALTIDAFLNTSVSAVRLHQFALQLLAEGQAQDAIAILDGIIEMAYKMAAKADKLVKKSSDLRDLGAEACDCATTDRSKTIKERREAEKFIADLKTKKRGLEERKSKLEKNVKDAEKREKEAMKEASTERHQNFVVGIFSAIFGGPRNTSTTSTPVSQDTAPEIAAKESKLKVEEAKLLVVQDDDEKMNIKKRRCLLRGCQVTLSLACIDPKQKNRRLLICHAGTLVSRARLLIKSLLSTIMVLKYDDKYVKPHSIYEVILMANQDKINWYELSGNPAAIELLTANQDKITWWRLSSNLAAIELLTANQDKIRWRELSINPAAIDLLIMNPDKINRNWLSGNPAANELLISNPDKIKWCGLSGNPAAIELLNANQDKIDWLQFCETVFLEYDTIKIADERGELNQAIIEAVHHPSRIQKWIDEGSDI